MRWVHHRLHGVALNQLVLGLGKQVEVVEVVVEVSSSIKYKIVDTGTNKGRRGIVVAVEVVLLFLLLRLAVLSHSTQMSPVSRGSWWLPMAVTVALLPFPVTLLLVKVEYVDMNITMFIMITTTTNI